MPEALVEQSETAVVVGNERNELTGTAEEVLERYLQWQAGTCGPSVVRAELPHVRGWLRTHPDKAAEREVEAWVMAAAPGSSARQGGYRGHRRRAMERFKRFIAETGGVRGLWRWIEPGEVMASEVLAAVLEEAAAMEERAAAPEPKPVPVESAAGVYVEERRGLVAEVLRLRDMREAALWRKSQDAVSRKLETAMVMMAHAADMAEDGRVAETAASVLEMERLVKEAMDLLVEEAAEVRRWVEGALRGSKGRERAEIEMAVRAGTWRERGGWGEGVGDLRTLERLVPNGLCEWVALVGEGLSGEARLMAERRGRWVRAAAAAEVEKVGAGEMPEGHSGGGE